MKRLLAALALVALSLAFMPRDPGGGRTAAQLATARALAGGAGFDIAAEPESPGAVHGGRRFAAVGPVGAITLSPFVALAERLRARHLLRGARLVESLWPAICAALLALLFHRGLLGRGAGPRAAWMGAALLALATPLWVSSRVPDGATLAALLLYGALLAARRGAAGALALGTAACALMLVEPAYATAAVVLVGVSIGLGLQRGPYLRPGLACALPTLVGVALLGLHRAHTGQLESSGDLAEGLVGLLLSTGKSLFVYAPPLMLLAWAAPSAWRLRRVDAAVSLVVVVAVLLEVARLPHWHGDPAWGPALLLPIIPLGLEPVVLWLDQRFAALRLHLRACVVALALAGVGVQLLGLLIAPTAYLRLVAVMRQQTGAPGWFGDPESDVHFIPQLSPLLGHAWMLRHYLGRKRNLGEDAPFRLVVPNVPKLDGEFGSLQLDLGWLPERVVR